MSKNIYGLCIVHPANASKPGWQESLPDKTGEPVLFFDNLYGAERIITECSKGEWCLSPKIGTTQEYLKIGSIGVIYRILAADELIEYARKQHQNNVNLEFLFSLSLPIDVVQDVKAIIPKDVLNDRQMVSLNSVSKILNARKEGMILLNSIIQSSSPEQIQKINLADKKTLESLRFLYSAQGLMTSSTSTPEYSQIRAIMKNILTAKESDITYALAASDLKKIFDKQMNNTDNIDTNKKIGLATQHVLDKIAHIAEAQGNFRMRSLLFSMQNQIKKTLS